MNTISLSLLQGLANHQKELVVIFHKDTVLLTNNNFNTFFKVSSTAEFNSSFGNFIDNFVPHPYYFHKEKMAKEESWFDAILKLPQDDRIVSMMTPNFEPHAFSIEIDIDTNEYYIVTFTDITQDLIKRIMIENHANMDKNSGAYAKEYFLQISKSYEYAAKYNEKSIASILISIEIKNSDDSKEFVNSFKNLIRKDDMLINWSSNSFILVYLVESQENAKQMFLKIQSIITKPPIKKFKSKLQLTIQEENENIKSLIKRI